MKVWPFSQLKALEKLQERDRFLVHLSNQSERREYGPMGDTLRDLSKRGHMNDGVTAIMVERAIGTVAKDSLMQALSFTAQVTDVFTPEILCHALIKQASALIDAAPPMDGLTAQIIARTTLKMAESISNNHVRDLAMGQWAGAVGTLATHDMPAALTEARRVVDSGSESLSAYGVLKWKSLVERCINEGYMDFAKEEVMTHGLGKHDLQPAAKEFIAMFVFGRTERPGTCVVELEEKLAEAYDVNPRDARFSALNTLLDANKLKLSGSNGVFSLLAADNRPLPEKEAMPIIAKLHDIVGVSAGCKPAARPA